MSDLSYEDIALNRVYDHGMRRTITEADNVVLSTLTLNLQPLHIDADFASKSMWGRVIVDSMVTIGVIMGIHGLGVTYGAEPAFPFIKEARFPHPVFHGDTLSARSTVVAKSDASAVEGCGDVEFLLEGFNQSGETIMACHFVQAVRKRS